MSYVPGTLLRIYPDASSSNHFTSIVLKNNTLLEIKNPNSPLKKDVFNTVELWCESRGVSIDSVKIDLSSVKQPFIPQITTSLTYNVPTHPHTVYHWVRWCYSIVCELAPQLLENTEFNTLYNQMVEYCTKYKMVLSHNTRVNRYSPDYIRLETIDYQNPINKWSGYMGNFTSYASVDMKQCRKDILCCYEQILIIIKPHIAEKMDTKWKILTTKHIISGCKRGIKYYTRSIQKLEAKIDTLQRIKKETEYSLIKYQQELDNIVDV